MSKRSKTPWGSSEPDALDEVSRRQVVRAMLLRRVLQTGSVRINELETFIGSDEFAARKIVPSFSIIAWGGGKIRDLIYDMAHYNALALGDYQFSGVSALRVVVDPTWPNFSVRRTMSSLDYMEMLSGHEKVDGTLERFPITTLMDHLGALAPRRP